MTDRRSTGVPTTLLAVLLAAAPAWASDHADPISLFRRRPPEPGLTGLFVFPADRDGRVVAPYQRPDQLPLSLDRDEGGRVRFPTRDKLPVSERGRIDRLIVILCACPGLTDPESLNLDPYTYEVHVDTDTPVSLDEPEYNARYGGRVGDDGRGENIDPDVTIGLRLACVGGKVRLQGPPRIQGLENPDRVQVAAEIFADPFLFPRFRNTNVVGMVVEIPLACFSRPPGTFLVWGVSRESNHQVDHVGRALRTQNPRFELLNTLPPRQHHDALQREREAPSLMTDLFLKFNFNSLFRFRDWDLVPDVMIYSLDHPPGFPNGRLPGDDVVAMLAQLGDTLAFELSYEHVGGRAPARPPVPREEFPYLADPYPNPSLPGEYRLRPGNKAKLILVFLACLVALFVENVLVFRWSRWQGRRRRYL